VIDAIGPTAIDRFKTFESYRREVIRRMDSANHIAVNMIKERRFKCFPTK
jgi:hypothetical protein